MEFTNYSLDQITALRRRVEQDLKTSSCLQDASQRLASILYEEFDPSTILVRVFATVTFGEIPDRDQRFVSRLAEARGCRPELDDETVVISLLGTRGKNREWNDRNRSRDRLGIPLLSASFIQTVPMLTRFLSATGAGIQWIDKQTTRILAKTFGQMAMVLYVDDAKKAETEDGFKILAAQDFVKAYNVRTAFGLGGGYLDGTFVAIVIFTNEHIEQRQVERFLPLVNTFKTATAKHAMSKQLFS
jgi:hypothetical protein